MTLLGTLVSYSSGSWAADAFWII